MKHPRTALLRRMTMAAAGVALTCVAAGPAAADERNQKTIFRFSEAVELPGRTLPAGTYTFVLADSPSSRHIVRVFNEDESQVITTLLAVSANRMEPSDDPIVSFAERGEEAAPAIQYWFYPGRTIGHEFVYPREQATRIARDTRKSVLASDAANGDEGAMASGTVTRIDPDGRESQYSERTAETAQQDRETAATATAMEGSPDRPAAPPAPRLSTDSDETSQASVPATTARPSSPAAGVQSGQQVDDRGARTDAQRDRSAMSAQQQTATRPSTLPQTAGPEPIFLLLGVSCALALGALGNIGRRM